MSMLEVAPGVRLCVRDRRPDAEDGPPVVLVHGWKQSHRLYDALAVKLVERGHRVVAFDTRGMGESDKPDAPFDFSDLAEDLGSVIDAAGVEDATLFGWSMGCSIALEYLASHNRGVGRVVLHNGPIRLTRRHDFPHAMPAKQLEDALREMADRWPASERPFLGESVLPGSSVDLVDLLVNVALQTPLDIALRICREQARLDHRPVIERLGIPVLAAYSVHDPYYPASLGRWIAEHAPLGRFASLHASAHCGPLEEPTVVADLVSGFRDAATT
jgi:pimeloyl-ACP methyl ester carboxylesterase